MNPRLAGSVNSKFSELKRKTNCDCTEYPTSTFGPHIDRDTQKHSNINMHAHMHSYTHKTVLFLYRGSKEYLKYYESQKGDFVERTGFFNHPL